MRCNCFAPRAGAKPGIPVNQIFAQIPAGELKTQIQNLSSNTELKYLQDLAKRTDINWDPIKLANEKISHIPSQN